MIKEKKLKANRLFTKHDTESFVQKKDTYPDFMSPKNFSSFYVKASNTVPEQKPVDIQALKDFSIMSDSRQLMRENTNSRKLSTDQKSSNVETLIDRIK